jgi:hypothetical protein
MLTRWTRPPRQALRIGPALVLGLLGWDMPRLRDVPSAIISHIRSCLRLPSDTSLDIAPRTLYHHHQSIRDYLQVRGWGREARHVADSRP